MSTLPARFFREHKMQIKKGKHLLYIACREAKDFLHARMPNILNDVGIVVDL